MSVMSKKIVKAAHKLEESAIEYKKLYEKENKKAAVVWLENKDTGECIFITDSYNTYLIKSVINEI